MYSTALAVRELVYCPDTVSNFKWRLAFCCHVASRGGIDGYGNGRQPVCEGLLVGNRGSAQLGLEVC